ncbi:hypothetical protein KEM55_005810 [Ascosphaera atra]|nr:hypothetical protein KEM55_005810 [Ascosphaera atra]
MQKTDPVVIVGGGFAGISTAHSVLRNIKPTPKVILVSASKQFYYKVSAPRAVVRPDLVPIDQITPDIQQAFAHYPDGKFEFMYAYARAVDTDVQNLIVESVEHPGSRRTVRYAALVVATGGKSLDPLWSPAGPVDNTKERMAAIHEKIVNAESIVVVGGGSLGIEVAGELGSEYGRKKAIALYSGYRDRRSSDGPGGGATAGIR